MGEALPDRPSRRLRFSLSTLPLLATIIGMALALGLLWRQVAPMQKELLTLRNETGQLSINDPSKAYALEVPTLEQNRWRWRFHLPAGVRYVLIDGQVLRPNSGPSEPDTLPKPTAMERRQFREWLVL